MNNGYRVIDVDTHVTPSFEVLMKYADSALRKREDELTPFVRMTKPTAGRGHPETEYGVMRVNPRPYARIAGLKEGQTEKGQGAGAKGSLEGRVENLAAKTGPTIHVGVQHENSAGRLLDMDVEGVDIDVIVPGTWACGASALDPTLAKGLYKSYHRYMAEFTSADARRLKGYVLAPCVDPAYAADMIRKLAAEDWVAGVWPILPEGTPIDDPDLLPVFDAMNEAHLPIVHHSFFYEPPYFPGYRDIWGNLAVAGTAAHMWGAQRLIAYVLVSGLFDKFENLKVGTIETGHGWLAHWLVRLSSQISYVKGATPSDLKYTPLEYAQQGRVFIAIEEHEGAVLTKGGIDVLGDGVFMYSSDYPHPESQFPHHVENVLKWEPTLGPVAMRKLMGENAEHFLRLQTTPWDNPAPAGN